MPRKRPLVYLITSGEATDANFGKKRLEIVALVKTAVDNDIPLVQLREKRLSAKHLFELALELAAITQQTETRLLINDRADIASVSGSAGVHLTTRSLAAAVVRKHFSNNLLIGVSTHTIAEVRTAQKGGADFAVFSPIFETPGKVSPTGTNSLRLICEQVETFPVIALGGINETNFQSVLDVGAAGFAAVRFLNDLGSIGCVMTKLANKP